MDTTQGLPTPATLDAGATAGARLAAFASGIRWPAVPEPVRRKVVDHVVDIIGVMFTGIDVEVCARTRRAVALWGDGDESTVVGTGERAPAASAAFVNALHGRIHTFDDIHELATLHAGSPVIASALALGEKRDIPGEAFLSSVLAGYEVATRVAAAIHPNHHVIGYHSTGTCGPFGTAAAAARVLGFDATATLETLGLAGATGAGLRQYQVDGSMLDSSFHAARAAQSGIMVAQMRSMDVSGPPGILDGPMGFCRVMARECDFTRLDADLGERFEFSEMALKPFPTCRFAQGPIDAALRLRSAHGIDANDIARVEISTFRQSIEVSSRPEIRTALDASFSHQFTVALALIHGEVSLQAIVNGTNAPDNVRSLVARTTVRHDPALEQEFPAAWPHRVDIFMRDGTHFSMKSDYPPGRVEPIPAQSIDSKFIRNAAACLGRDGANRALEALRTIGTATGLKAVTPLLAGRAVR